MVHLVVAETDDEAIAIATPAWEKYRWNLAAPRRLEAEKRGLTQFMHSKDGSFGFVGERPAGLPARETRRDISAELERFDEQKHRANPNRLGGVALAGSLGAVREYMDEYVATGANYFVCSFQWGDLTHDQAMQSIDLCHGSDAPLRAGIPGGAGVATGVGPCPYDTGLPYFNSYHTEASHIVANILCILLATLTLGLVYLPAAPLYSSKETRRATR